MPEGSDDELELLPAQLAETRHAMQALEERYQSVALASRECFWDVDIATGTVLYDEGFTSLFGHARTADLDARTTASAWWIEHIHPDDRARVQSTYEAETEGGAKTWMQEYRFRRADGSFALVSERVQTQRAEVHRKRG